MAESAGLHDALHAGVLAGDLAVVLHEALVPVAEVTHAVTKQEQTPVVDGVRVCEPCVVVDLGRGTAGGAQGVGAGHGTGAGRAGAVVEEVDRGALGVEARDHVGGQLLRCDRRPCRYGREEGECHGEGNKGQDGDPEGLGSGSFEHRFASDGSRIIDTYFIITFR